MEEESKNPPAGKQPSGFAKFSRRGIAPYLFLAGAIIVSYLLFEQLALTQSGLQMQKIMLLGIGGVAAWALCLLRYKKLDARRAVMLLLIAGFIMRIGVMLYTPFDVRQHDVGGAFDCGHINYILDMAKFQLPATNYNQFYHPPFYYFLAGIVYNIANGITHVSDAGMETVKIIPCFASCATAILSVRIFRELRFSGTAQVIAAAVVCLHPCFFYLAPSINNDALSIFFITSAILYIVKWYRRQSMRNTVFLALSIGLGMMTKLSVVVITPVAAAVFIYVFFRDYGGFKKTGPVLSRAREKLVSRFGVFLCISVPLGLWYSVRNYVLFHQSLGYVLKLSTGIAQYKGNASFASRFLSLPLIREMFANGHIFSDMDHNLSVYVLLLKTSIFGEWNYSFENLSGEARYYMLANLILIVVSLLAAVYVLVFGRDRFTRLRKTLLLFIWLILMGFYINFNISYPFGCTADFRYIVPTVITGAGFLGLGYDVMARRHPNALPYAAGLLTFSVMLFAFHSILFYTII